MQCAKRLHLEFHRPDEIPEPTVRHQFLMEAGKQLLELACQGFPNGRSVDTDDADEAAEQTREILSQEEGTAVFNAGFVSSIRDQCDEYRAVAEPNAYRRIEVRGSPSACKPPQAARSERSERSQ